MSTLRQCDWFILSQAVEGGRHLRTYWWDWPGNITGNWGRKYFPPERDTHDFAIGYSNTWRMFGRYKTEEIIAPRFSDRREEIRAEQERLRPESSEADQPRGSAALGRLPAPVAAIIEDAAGSGVGVVLLQDIANKLRAYWRMPKAPMSKLIWRFERYGVEVLRDGEQPYVVYEPQTAQAA